MMSSEFWKSRVLSGDREEGKDGSWGPEWEARVHSVPVPGTGKGGDFLSGDRLHTEQPRPSADWPLFRPMSSPMTGRVPPNLH